MKTNFTIILMFISILGFPIGVFAQQWQLAEGTADNPLPQ